MALFVVPIVATALTAEKTKSLILLEPGAAVEVKLRQLDISLGAAAVSEEVQIDIYRVETIGTPAGTGPTAPQLANEMGSAAQSKALTILTTEPTAVKVLASYMVQPLGGLFSMPLPYGSEIIAKPGGARLGVRYVTPAGVAPKCLANLWFEE